MDPIYLRPNYDERIAKAATFNKHLHHERRMRLPFLDSQTGLAQSHTTLLPPRHFRLKGCWHGQVFSYPEKRWKKKKSTWTYDLVSQSQDDTAVSAKDTGSREHRSDNHQVTAPESFAVKESYERSVKELHLDKSVEMGRYYLEDWDNGSEQPDVGEYDLGHSDGSDFEESMKKRKKKSKAKSKGGSKKTSSGRDRKSTAEPTEPANPYDEAIEKPYSCSFCGMRYKTKPGLSYHLNHHHPKANQPVEPDEWAASPATETNQSIPASTVASTTSANNADTAPDTNTKYCDFCLGNEHENKKTGMREELVSCADCGRSGHPSCLQFTPNMIISVKKYPWQCIECKSCGLCGTSENDDQLLFCDDCDRGFHMYCLKPPLTEPPDGNWSCHLCINEFYGGKKPEGME